MTYTLKIGGQMFREGYTSSLHAESDALSLIRSWSSRNIKVPPITIEDETGKVVWRHLDS